MNLVQNLASVIEPKKKRTGAALFLRREKAMLTRDIARVLRKSVGTEDLPSNRTNETLSSAFTSAKKIANPGRGAAGRVYRRHLMLNVPENIAVATAPAAL